MGNCLVVEENMIKVMKADGEVLEYEAPIKVHQVLSEFSGHTISDTLPVVRRLRLDSELVGGHLYYLLPAPLEVDNKKVLRFSNPVVEAAGQAGTGGVVRIKMVISKQELEAMLRKGGALSSNDMVSQLLKKQSSTNDMVDHDFDGDDGNENCRGWKPALESIPEVN
ncbi:uncharacterized protein LOC132285092 [Cornus florida]|uniref:uncharacterized protein LOC132285092 n=1 Tax=Cornus florida TaxID=4283 RepID=UPI00289FA85E|nr:uncharacterized protein LOC132285092 [Cornus florida]